MTRLMTATERSYSGKESDLIVFIAPAIGHWGLPIFQIRAYDALRVTSVTLGTPKGFGRDMNTIGYEAFLPSFFATDYTIQILSRCCSGSA